MGPDVFLVAGVIIGALAIPSILNAYSEGRSPRTAALMILVSGCCIVFAVSSSPVGYTMQDVPNAFVRVFSRFLH